MRKLIFLLIFIVVIIAAIPFIDGYLYKKEFISVISSISERYNDKSLKVEITEYHLGWLHSTATTRVMSTDPNTLKYMPEGITIDHEITHGPFVYDLANDKYSLACAYDISRIYLPSNLQKMLMPKQQDQPIVEADTLASFNNIWTSHIKIAALTLPGVGTLALGDSTGTLIFSIQDNKLTKLNATYEMGAVSFKSISGNPSVPSVYLQPSHSSVDSVRQASALWNMTEAFSTTGLLINWPDNSSVVISNIDGKSNNGVDANNLSQLNSEITIKSIRSPAFFISSFSDVNVTFGMNNLNPAGISKYNDTAMDAQIAASNLKNFLTPTSNLSLKVSFNSNLGALLSSTKISLKPKIDLSNMQLPDIYSSMQLESNNKIAYPLLTQIVIKYLEKTDEFTSQMQPVDASINAPKNDALQDMVGNLFRDGKITMQQSMDIFGVISDKPNEAVFAQRVTQISPKNAAGLTQAYRVKLIQDAQAAANKPAPETKEQRAQEMIAKWMQQGYLVTEGNDCIFNVTNSDGMLKINGKALNVPGMSSEMSPAMPAPAPAMPTQTMPVTTVPVTTRPVTTPTPTP